MKLIGSPRKEAAIGCLLLAFLFAISLAIWLLPGIPGTRRVPNEVPLGSLLQSQVTALGPGWTLSSESYLTIDSDLTRGRWVSETSFEHLYPYATVRFDFHTFGSPVLAKRLFPPSGIPFDFELSGNPPEGWNYVPHNSDRFIIDCTPRATPDVCFILIVYREYSMVFRADMADVITVMDLQRFIQATDEFMYDYLSSTTLEPGRREVPTLDELGLSK